MPKLQPKCPLVVVMYCLLCGGGGGGAIVGVISLLGDVVDACGWFLVVLVRCWWLC